MWFCIDVSIERVKEAGDGPKLQYLALAGGWLFVPSTQV